MNTLKIEYDGEASLAPAAEIIRNGKVLHWTHTLSDGSLTFAQIQEYRHHEHKSYQGEEQTT